MACFISIQSTDASDTGLGAVLSEDQNGTEAVITYASRTLTKPEVNYYVTRRELIAVIFYSSRATFLT